jgi:protein ImuB
MRRMLSVWLPSWPTQRLIRLAAPALSDSELSAELPLATVENVRGMRRLAAVCPRAAALGLRPEQSLAEARAMCPDLAVADADPDADRAALARLATWCERYTPLAAADPPDGLFLDITGCAHFFGDGEGLSGEAALAENLRARLERGGLTGRVAIAGSAGAAWALARSATARSDCTVLPPGEETRGMALQPVATLRLDPRTVAGLRRVGLRTVGELARLPRGELAARYGAATLLRLDQAHGRAAEAIVWPHPPPPWEERLAFAEPIGTADDFSRTLDLLAARLCARLEAGGLGGRRFAACFFRVDDIRPEIAIGTALPVRDPAYVAKLLRARLDTVDPGFGVDAVTLAATEIFPLASPQGRLGDLAAPQETALAATVDELGNRLGERRLWRPAPAESHIPERAVRRQPPLATPRRERGATREIAWEEDLSRERPVRLFRRPVPIDVIAPVPDDPPILFRWRGSTHRVRAADGPERISAEWWRRRERSEDGEDPVRDYYRVEDMDGARFWIFRAGLLGETPTPRWYLHGLFG